MTRDEYFHARVQDVRNYARVHGHAQVPRSYKLTRESTSIALGEWCGYMRKRYRAGLLNEVQISELESINGWAWSYNRDRKKSEEKKVRVHELRAKRYSLQEIADAMNMSRQRVHQILKAGIS